MPRKIEPAVQTLTFAGLTVPASATADWTIDISQCASIANRRFYRQGLNWAVQSVKIVSGQNQSSFVQLSKLPNTWVMSNAWEKGFRAWQKMNKAALEEAESVKPKFLDFKIYADATHHNDGFGDNLLPFAHDAGEWESSKYQIPDNTLGATGGVREREVIAVGPNFPGAGASGLDAVSLIEGYAASRGLPDIKDPNTPADAGDVGGSGENWISQLFSEGSLQDDKVLEDMISENNQAPYPFENGEIPGGGGATWTDTYYPGGANQAGILQLHDQEYQSSTTIGGVTMLKGGNFPCGLMRITATNLDTEEDAGYTIQVNLVPGTHRGYLAEPMTEM